MENLIISHITSDKINECAEVMRKAFNYVDQGWSEEDSIKYIKRILPYSCSLIAELDGKCVGIMGAEARDDHLFIDSVGVDPDFMGKGIGKELWNYALNHAKEKNLTKIKMISDPNSLAFQWYIRLGFKETGWVELEINI